ncbi:MAG: spheroidene monooxygenase, partial [Actinobacteria bacterium]|nr:spheroidene monooxygenase [Actinomycetota bacterium]
EAPIGLQGTFSIWDSGSALRQFAYKGAAHTDAIKATSLNNWYSEELFARFAVIQERGRLN